MLYGLSHHYGFAYTIFSHLKSLFTKRKNRIGKTGFNLPATKRITVYYVTQVGRRVGRFVMFLFNKSQAVEQVARGGVAKRAEEKNKKGVLSTSRQASGVFEMQGVPHKGLIYHRNPLTKNYEPLQKVHAKVLDEVKIQGHYTFLYFPLKK